MKSKLKLIVPLVLLVVLGGGYKFAFAKPDEPAPKPKVEGEVYVLPKEFLVNLSDGRFAKLGVGMVFHHGFTATPEAAGGHGAAPKPPEGFGVLTQEPIVRDIITDVLTSADARDLTDREGREQLKAKIGKRIKKTTDVKVDEVLFMDVAVQ